MGLPNRPGDVPDPGTLSFSFMIEKYVLLQGEVMKAVRNLASNMSSATPGKFLLLQFQMSQVTQVGESISNLIMQVNSVIKNAVGNQRQ
jgi:hypothetical protein